MCGFFNVPADRNHEDAEDGRYAQSGQTWRACAVPAKSCIINLISQTLKISETFRFQAESLDGRWKVSFIRRLWVRNLIIVLP